VAIALPTPVNERSTAQPTEVVVCGTYRRALEGLRRDVDELRNAGCIVLSPGTLDFVGVRDGFVFSSGEEGEAPGAIELRHLEAIRRCDFVWFHVPDGYVGPSGAMELGFARGHGIPVYATELPSDVTLRCFVEVVPSAAAAAERMRVPRSQPPSAPLAGLQHYYDKVARERGYDSESARDCLLLMTEEVGELARAIRKSVGLARAGGFANVDAARELADIQLYAVHLANILRIDLGAAVALKEQENAERVAASRAQVDSSQPTPLAEAAA